MASEAKRVRYSSGQLLLQRDFDTEQDYHLQQSREHQRWLHTAGVAEGFAVTPGATASSVAIGAGTAYDDLGRRIVRTTGFDFDLTNTPGAGGGESAVVYVTATWDQREGSELGDSINTRFIEEAKIEKSASRPSNDRQTLVLAKVTRTGTNVGTIDTDERLQAGAAVGDIEVPSATLKDDGLPRGDWVTLSLAAARQAQLAGSLEVTQDITARGRNLTTELDTLNAHRTSTANPHQTTAAQIDTAGGGNQIVMQINSNTTGSINQARIDTAIARAADLAAHSGNTANPHQTTAVQIDGPTGSNLIVARINAGTGIINAARMPEKLNGILKYGRVDLSAAGATPPILLTSRDLRNKLVRVHGWASSVTDLTPNFLATTTTIKTWTWDPSPPMSAKELWVYCRPTATGTTSLFSLVEGASNASFQLEFTTTALNLRVSGSPSFSFGYVFQFTWQET